MLAKRGYEKSRSAYTERQKAIEIRANAIRERAAKRAPAGERERLVAANGIAVCLAAFAMAFCRRNAIIDSSRYKQK